MTCPTVEVRGSDLPEPFDGLDSSENINTDRTEATYLPDTFTLTDSTLYLGYSAPDDDGRRVWVNLDNVDSIRVHHDD